MFVLSESPTLFVDVDETLVGRPNIGPMLTHEGWVLCNSGEPYEAWVRVHQEHVRTLLEFKARGFNIVVWSAGGSKWAETVVFLLGLSGVVDVVMSKPTWFLDDKPACEFMPEHNRIWRKDEPCNRIIQETK